MNYIETERRKARLFKVKVGIQDLLKVTQRNLGITKSFTQLRKGFFAKKQHKRENTKDNIQESVIEEDEEQLVDDEELVDKIKEQMEEKKLQSMKSNRALSGVNEEQVFMGLEENNRKEMEGDTERNLDSQRPLKK